MARHKDKDWTLPDKLETWEQVNTAVLMDIRDELKQLNNSITGIRGCPSVLLALNGAAEIGKEFRRRAKSRRAKTRAKRGTTR